MFKLHSTFIKPYLSHLSWQVISKVRLLERVRICLIHVSPQQLSSKSLKWKPVPQLPPSSGGLDALGILFPWLLQHHPLWFSSYLSVFLESNLVTEFSSVAYSLNAAPPGSTLDTLPFLLWGISPMRLVSPVPRMLTFPSSLSLSELPASSSGSPGRPGPPTQ